MLFEEISEAQEAIMADQSWRQELQQTELARLRQLIQHLEVPTKCSGPGRSVPKKGLYRAGQYQNPLGGS